MSIADLSDEIDAVDIERWVDVFTDCVKEVTRPDGTCDLREVVPLLGRRIGDPKLATALAVMAAKTSQREGLPLTEAYAKSVAITAERDRAGRASLRAEAPDLVELVDAGNLPLSRAWAALCGRRHQIKMIRAGGPSAAKRLVEFCAWVTCIDQAMSVGEKDILDPDVVDRVVESTKQLERLWRAQSGDAAPRAGAIYVGLLGDSK